MRYLLFEMKISMIFDPQAGLAVQYFIIQMNKINTQYTYLSLDLSGFHFSLNLFNFNHKLLSVINQIFVWAFFNF